MTAKKDIWLALTTDPCPYDEIRHLFPDELIPIKAPFPLVSAGEESEPCYLVDANRLNQEQKQALADLIYAKYEINPEMTLQEANNQVKRGLPISHQWCEDIIGDPDFEGDPEARLWAFEFNSLSNEPSIDIQISPLAAWYLISQLQVAARHPANVGPAVQDARMIADQLLERMEPSAAMRAFMARGWDSDQDVRLS